MIEVRNQADSDDIAQMAVEFRFLLTKFIDGKIMARNRMMGHSQIYCQKVMLSRFATFLYSATQKRFQFLRIFEKVLRMKFLSGTITEVKSG
jgi:hypothetical protein